MQDEEIPGERRSHRQRCKQETATPISNELGEIPTAAGENGYGEQCVERQQGILPSRTRPDTVPFCQGQLKPRSPDLKSHGSYP
jgi:hypothetical protein